MTSVHDRIDPEVAEGLEGYFKLVGPGGLGAISDLGERRARLSAVMAMAGAAAGPSDDIETSDHLVPDLPAPLRCRSACTGRRMRMGHCPAFSISTAAA